MLLGCNAPWLLLIMKLGPLPDAYQTPAGRHGSGHSLRLNALDPRFHDVPAGPAQPDGEADGVGVT